MIERLLVSQGLEEDERGTALTNTARVSNWKTVVANRKHSFIRDGGRSN